MPPDDLVFVQPPVMTDEHLDAMRKTVLLYSYADTMFRRSCLDEILAHLEALLRQPTPSREVTRMRVEAIDPDGTPVTFEGEVTKTRHEAWPKLNREPLSPDWRREFAPLDMTTYESDQ